MKTWKGHQFNGSELSATRRAKMTPEAVKAWAEEQTKKFRIVAQDGEYPVIAEELVERSVRRVNSPARESVRHLLTLTGPQRREVLAAFDKSGELVIPFKRN